MLVARLKKVPVKRTLGRFWNMLALCGIRFTVYMTMHFAHSICRCLVCTGEIRSLFKHNKNKEKLAWVSLEGAVSAFHLSFFFFFFKFVYYKQTGISASSYLQQPNYISCRKQTILAKLNRMPEKKKKKLFVCAYHINLLIFLFIYLFQLPHSARGGIIEWKGQKKKKDKENKIK